MDTDALAYLAANPAARTLLGAYQGDVPPSGATWSPRLFDVAGIESTQLSALHGRLIAFGYLDVDVSDAAVGIRYQVTTTGRQHLIQSSCTDTAVLPAAEHAAGTSDESADEVVEEVAEEVAPAL